MISFPPFIGVPVEGEISAIFTRSQSRLGQTMKTPLLLLLLSSALMFHHSAVGATNGPVAATATATLPGVSNAYYDIRAFGAVDDGITDNTAIIKNAIASIPDGATLLFPCTTATSNGYLVTAPIDFGGKSNINIEGTNKSCRIIYASSVNHGHAFSVVGAKYICFKDVQLFSGNTTHPPKVVLLMGRAASSDSAGNYSFQRVSVGGYATKAVVYSIGSECNSWDNVHLTLNGGGALYVFFTSQSDELSIAALPTASNLGNWFSHSSVSDYSSQIGAGPNHSLFYIGGTQGGDSVFRDGYLSSLGGTAFTFGNTGGRWTIDSNRFENGYQMVNFPTASSVANVRLTNNTCATRNGNYLVNSHPEAVLVNAVFEGNHVYGSTVNTAKFPTLMNSRVMENYDFTCVKAVRSILANLNAGTYEFFDGQAVRHAMP